MPVKRDTTIAANCPDLIPAIRRVEKFLSECERSLASDLREITQETGRKRAGAERRVFAADLVSIILDAVGAPHYEMVAALTAVVFNTAEDISPDAVKMAYRSHVARRSG
jgi:hypothetical protein